MNNNDQNPFSSAPAFLSTTPAAKPSFAIINNRYKIIKTLGKGGMGTVYLVEDLLQENRPIALKQIDKDLLNKENLQIFKQEFEVMSRLKHPNLIGVYDFGFDIPRNTYYITMEYLNGSSLKDVIKENGALAPDKAISIMIDLCRAITFIHSRKILHRDINPSNIIITSTGQVKIMDFGLADLEHNDHQRKGTIPYMAPEIFKNTCDHRVDIFALGCTFYEMVNNFWIYEQPSSQYIVSLLLDQHYFTNTKKLMMDKICHPLLRTVIGTMTEYSPELRYNSCTKVIEALSTGLGVSIEIETEQTREAYILGAGFVGRENELVRLKQHLESSEKSPKALWVQGGPGVGKSRLFYEFKKYCQMHNCIFFEGNCYENFYKQFSPFIPVVNELLQHAEEPLIQTFGPLLKKVFPDHQRLILLDPPETLDPRSEHLLMIQTMSAFIIAAVSSNPQPCIIYLNDIQWADESSRELVDELLRQRAEQTGESKSCCNPSLYLFLSSRIENIEGLFSEQKNDRFDILPLQPFDEHMVKRYFEAVFGENTVGTHLQASIPMIHTKVGGNPFFLQELTKALVTHGFIIRTADVWELQQPIDTITIPLQLQELVTSSLDRLRLDEYQRRIVNIIALMNRAVCADELNQIITVNPSFLHELVRQEILKSEYGKGFFTYRIAHDLIRATVIEQIPDRASIHQQIAQSLETIHAAHLEAYIDELAHHYFVAHNNQKAAVYLELAGKQAQDKFENEKAVAFYDLLLSLLQEHETDKKIEILKLKTKIFQIIDSASQSIAVLRQLIHLTEKVGDVQKTAELYYLLGFNLQSFSDHSCLEMFQKGLHLATVSDNKIIMIRILSTMGYYYMRLANNYTKAMESLQQAKAIIEKNTDAAGIREVTSHAYSCIAQVYNAQGNFMSAIEHILEAVRIFEELIQEKKAMNNTFPLQRNYALSLCQAGEYYANTAQYTTAMSYFDKSLKQFDEIGNKGLRTYVLTKKCKALFLQKLFREAKKVCNEALKHVPESTEIRGKFAVDVIAAKISYALGDKRTGKQELLSLLEQTNDPHERAELFYELWCMDKETVYRNEALQLYQDICTTTPLDYLFQQRLKELDANQCKDYYSIDAPPLKNKRENRRFYYRY